MLQAEMWLDRPPQILFQPSDRFPDGMAYTQGYLRPVGDSEENARLSTTGGLQHSGSSDEEGLSICAAFAAPDDRSCANGLRAARRRHEEAA